MKMVSLNMVVAVRTMEGEDDIVSHTESTAPVTIVNPEATVRSFNPRKPREDGTPREGTRIVFTNGKALVVKESYDAVASAFAAVA